MRRRICARSMILRRISTGLSKSPARRLIPNRALPICDDARLLGVLHPEEMRRHLAEAAIFASPALYEPFGLTVLEAAAAGCTLVLGDIASLRENWEGAAIFLPPADASAWQVTLTRLINNRQERDRLAAAAHIRAQRFTLANTARRYRALYCELTHDRAKGRAA